MLLSVVIFQLLLAPALTLPRVDHWESWGPYGECSRSCGSGVTVRTRRCNTYRTDGGHNCVGPDKSYRSCNIQDCPEGSKDFREEQCSQFDGTDFQGKRYKWLPYYGAENPCELNCMPRGENFFYRHRTAVADGTPCHPGRRDVCVGGVCKRLGCDNVLESPQREDPCLQCGGNGQSCTRVKNSFSLSDLPTGYNQMFIIPVGATTISIRETTASRNYLAIKNLRGEYYLNGHWVIEFSRATPIAGTMLYYQRGAEGDSIPETIIGRGPTTEPLVVELISQEPNQGVEYEYYLSNGRSRESYFWSFGSWSSCSKECGLGYQSRLVFCTIDNESYPDYLCASLSRPQTNQTCNPHPCPEIRRMAYLYPPQLWRSSETPRVFSWRTGEWNTCSVSCGGGSQVRRVDCVSHDASGPRVVEDAVCAASAAAPPSLQTCNMHRCAEYRATRWSACSVTCGSGEQTREVTCVGSRGVRLEETSCSTLLLPSAVRPCRMAACPAEIGWHVGEWGQCSRSCGSGSRDRQVICSDPERNQYPVDRCNTQPKPSTVERCNIQPCYRAQAHRPEIDASQTNTVHDPHGSVPVLHCSQSYYGCCPDGRTSAGGPQGLGCPMAQAPDPRQPSCSQSSYGCCQDGLAAAQGPNMEGCVEDVAPASTVASLPTENAVQCRTTTYGCCYDRTSPAAGPSGEGCPNPPNHIERSSCSLPRAAGSCDSWVSRYHYDVLTSSCNHFWYGSCHGNSNNFMSREECQRACQAPSEEDLDLADRTTRGGAVPPTEAWLLVDRQWLLPLTLTGADFISATAGLLPLLPRNVLVQQRGKTHEDPVGMTTSPGPGPTSTSLPPLLKEPRLTLGGVTIDKSDPSTVEALAGQTVVLPCRVSPPPSSTVTVEWRRDGIPLSTHRHHQQPNGSLLVGPLTKLDSGWFLCAATRERERDHRYIYLSVTEGSSKLTPTSLPGDGPFPR
ncbi:papilin [Brachionichthys hirsutus]|uniref:papilin n=1 Tax=Brachionichthys hirsutus TaxID=412623 RepID=UPI003604E9E5